MEKVLWAPWRIGYILQQKVTGCLFCHVVRKKKDRKNLVLERKKHCFVMLNKYPYNNGHIMIIPYVHRADLDRIEDKVLLEMMQAAREYGIRMKKRMRAEGFNIGINIGKIAGAGIAGHLHLHVVPRWSGDSNFMPVLGKTKVISESFESVYDKLSR
ncbi:MAG: HIT domain-containing protein [bacterium]|nr:HIT domain-containing protein [bacterium]